MSNIAIIKSAQDDVLQLKKHLFSHFQTKDLGLLTYFLSIEVAQSNSGIIISQRKYGYFGRNRDIRLQTDKLSYGS